MFFYELKTDRMRTTQTLRPLFHKTQQNRTQNPFLPSENRVNTLTCKPTNQLTHTQLIEKRHL